MSWGVEEIAVKTMIDDFGLMNSRSDERRFYYFSLLGFAIQDGDENNGRSISRRRCGLSRRLPYTVYSISHYDTPLCRLSMVDISTAVVAIVIIDYSVSAKKAVVGNILPSVFPKTYRSVLAPSWLSVDQSSLENRLRGV